MRHAFTPPANYDLFRVAAAVSEQAGHAVHLAAELDDSGQAWLLVTDPQGEPVEIDPGVLDTAMQAEADQQQPSDPSDDLAVRIRAVHDDPQVSASVKKLTAALLGLNGEAAVAGRPTTSR
jgi:hypothetical protein